MTFISAAGIAAPYGLQSLGAGNSFGRRACDDCHLSIEPRGAHLPFVVATGDAIELCLPVDPASALLCRIHLDCNDHAQIRRHWGRVLNDQRSAQLLGGLVLLLALCGWVVGGDETAHALIVGATPSRDSVPTPEVMRQRFGAVPLYPFVLPKVFDSVAGISRRAGLAQVPRLYYIAGREKMNAYAFGRSEASAIAVTEGLLRGLNFAEVTSLIAHEIAHISSNDAWTISFADALQQGIARVAPFAFASARRHSAVSSLKPLEALLAFAPSLAQLLYLGLSRTRERNADAIALQLTDNPLALAAALAKLEHHHNGDAAASLGNLHADMKRYLRSHPATYDRVGMLLDLAA